MSVAPSGLAFEGGKEYTEYNPVHMAKMNQNETAAVTITKNMRSFLSTRVLSDWANPERSNIAFFCGNFNHCGRPGENK